MSLLLIFPKPWCCRTKPKGHLVQRQQFCVLRKCDSGCPKGCRESSRHREWSGAVEPGPGLQTLVCWSAGCCWLCSGQFLLSLSWGLGLGWGLPPAPGVLWSRARSHLPNAHYLEAAVTPSVP